MAKKNFVAMGTHTPRMGGALAIPVRPTSTPPGKAPGHWQPPPTKQPKSVWRVLYTLAPLIPPFGWHDL